MKKIIQSLIYLSIAMVFFASCEKDEARDTFVSGTNPVFTASVQDNIELNFNTENEKAVTFNWTNPNYYFASGVSSQNVAYTIEIDTAGANFNGKNKLSVSVSQDLTKTYTQKEFNILISDLKLKTGSVAELEMRVMASLGNILTNRTSNKLTFEVVPYAPPPKVILPESNSLFIVGSATPGGWDNPVPVPSQQFTKISNTVYEISIPLKGGEKFIFLVNNGDWGKKYAVVDDSNNGLDVALDFAYFTSGGKDIPGPAVSGNYKIRVDFQTGKYTISKI
jgi:hypothetical protein